MKENIKDSIRSNKLLYSFAKKMVGLKNIFKSKKKPISGLNNQIISKGLINNVEYDIIGNNNSIQIGEGAILSNIRIFMRGDNHRLSIGGNCKYAGGSFWFEDNNCQIVLGEKTTVESAHLAVTEPYSSITIGNDCMFSNNIEFRTGDSHSIIDESTKERINYAKNIEIGNHVWIGANATILKGVKIGDNSIISTGAIVTNEIPGNCIAGGIPAKVIKTGVNWLRQRIYQK